MAEEKTVTTTAAETGEKQEAAEGTVQESRKLRRRPMTRHMWTT